MTNEDILKYHSMIHKIINKYNSRYHDKDDLYQIGAIGIIYAYESYNPNSNMAFDTWVYNCIQWQVLRALRLDTKNKDIKEVSIYEEVPGGEDIQLIDMIEDITIDIHKSAEVRLMEKFYISEFERLLENEQRDYITYMYTHNNFNYKEVAALFGVGYAHLRNELNKAYRKLSHSPYFLNLMREERNRKDLIRADEYNRNVLDCVISRNRLERYPGNTEAIIDVYKQFDIY
ncbi:MAG: sigma-70 family RNA polymerase sigma factor [Peptostreptococcus sp.]|uniref:sigma-70 family RNA polymerase sigma factor n=2 Tax=Peptostreptococcus sp. TaxID=1262 RepID=UPI00290C2051|nr:sigma-70 family RNA polymerase sigma factor [Peptostreptococcus sp.]MDU5350427.1 sigma-70 family RNA polymerase sigma factor [Peptostreptococcus sp.]